MKGLARSIGRGSPQQAPIVKQKVFLTAVPISATCVGSAVGFGTAVIGDIPEGNLLLLGAIAYLQFSSSSANLITTYSGNFSIGSAPTADNALTGSEVDFIPSTAISAATAKVTPVLRGANGTVILLNNTDTTLELNLNILIAAASITDDTTAALTVSGFVELAYIMLGDN